MESRSSQSRDSSSEDPFELLYPGRKPLTKEELSGFGKQHRKFSSPFFIDIVDLNNQNEKDILDCNPPKMAIVAGLKFTF